MTNIPKDKRKSYLLILLGVFLTGFEIGIGKYNRRNRYSRETHTV